MCFFFTTWLKYQHKLSATENHLWCFCNDHEAYLKIFGIDIIVINESKILLWSNYTCILFIILNIIQNRLFFRFSITHHKTKLYFLFIFIMLDINIIASMHWILMRNLVKIQLKFLKVYNFVFDNSFVENVLCELINSKDVFWMFTDVLVNNQRSETIKLWQTFMKKYVVIK